MAFDNHKNFAYGTVLTAPSPATSGTTLVLNSGEGARFPAAPFPITIWPVGVQPLASNAEVARCTAISTDTLTITRAQESSTARSIVIGDQVAATITAGTLGSIETSMSPSDGWIPISGFSFTYASTSSATSTTPLQYVLNTSSDFSGTVNVGDFFKCTHSSSTKFFLITGITSTTMTVNGGTDFSLAATAITNPYFSKQLNPQGWPGRFHYTPVFTGFSVAPTVNAFFAPTGRSVTNFCYTTGAGTSNAATFTVTGGVTAANEGALAYAPASVVDSGSGQSSPGLGRTVQNSAQIQVFKGWNDLGWTSSGSKYASFTITYPM